MTKKMFGTSVGRNLAASFVAILCVLLAACGSAQPVTSSPAAASPAADAKPASATSAVQGSAPASVKPGAAASAAASAGGSAKLAASAAGEKVIVVYSTIASLYLPLWYGQEAGIFARNGINAEVQLLSNSSAAMAALLSGNAQIYQGGRSDIVSAVVGGADLVALATIAPVYPYKLEVAPEIKTPQDLKGKKLAIASQGDTSDVATRLTLQKFGLEPDKDVALIAVGGVPQRTAALVGGAVQGTVDSPPSVFALEAQGFHPLFDITALGLPSANQVVTVQRSYLSSHRDLIQRYVDSMIQSFAKLKTDKPRGVELMKRYYKSDDESAMSRGYDYATQEAIAALPYPKVEQFKDSIDILSKTKPKVVGFNVASILDDSFVKSAAERHLDTTPQ